MGVSDGVEEALPPPTGSNEENIFLSVRVRPLNAKEISRNDVSDWECIDENTIIYKNANLLPPERSMFPSSYTFDRVFSAESSTRQVYNEGSKQVALSVLSGVNSSVFAYGQTSSGKTYTMTGITEYTIADIYDYVQKHTERDFILKFSAIEIYNESVRDLLSLDATPLRLLDDPERGTIIEKLTEETIRDWKHVIKLLSICEAHRKIGETPLNETHSGSHQIIRLMIESSAREHLGKDNSSTLTSTVSFVDLAGSERASQILSDSIRLKEGCHINRSLLTLGTVIRKLSKGRNAHIPYRDSKLTRILQSSLGGNARIAIICTMTPARSHVEQTRNTFLFASCAKEVTTNAQLNVVVSDKALAKHAQRELTRLQTELKNPGSSFDGSRYAALLHEKDAQIEKLEKELKDVTLERDLAQSQVEDLVKLIIEDDNLLMRVGQSNYPNLRVQISPDSLHILRGGTPSIHSQASFRTFGTSRYSDQHSRTSSDDNYAQIPDFEGTYIHTGPSPGLFIGETHFSGSDLDEMEKQSNASSEDLLKDIGCREESKVKSKTGLTPPKVNPDNISAPIAVVIGDSDNIESLSAQQDEEGQLAHDSINEDTKFDESMVKNDRGTVNFITSLACYKKPSPWYEGAIDLSSSRSSNVLKSRSCKARIMVGTLPPRIEKIRNNEGTPPNGSEKELACRPQGCLLGDTSGPSSQAVDMRRCQLGHNKGPQRIFSTLNFNAHEDASLSEEQYKSSHETICNVAIEEQNQTTSNTDGTKEMTMIQDDSKCVENNEGTPPNGSEKELISRPQGSPQAVDMGQCRLGHNKGPQKIFSTLNFGIHADASLSEEQYKSSQTAIEEQNQTTSNIDGTKEMAMIHDDNKCVENNEGTPPNGFEKIQKNEGTPPNGSEEELTDSKGCLLGDTSGPSPQAVDTGRCRLGHNKGPQNISSTLNFGIHEDASLFEEQYKSSQETVCNVATEEQNQTASNTDGTKEMAMIQDDSKCVENPSTESGVTSYESKRSIVKDVRLDPIEEVVKHTSDWPNEFKRLRKEIIQLWHACYVPLVHRAHFFLLFKGDLSDSIYMEVELRRLHFLKESFSRGKVVQDGRTITPTSSLKALRRERRMLSKQMQKRLSEEERKSLYLKWNVSVHSKNRRLQVADRLWSDTKDMEHITNSAILVAKLVCLVQPEHAPKEVFALNFSPARSTKPRSIRRSLSSLL